MKRILLLRICVLVVVVLIYLNTSIALAQERVGYELTQSVMGSGGMGGVSGNVSISSTLGQPLAGVSGDGILFSGFWSFYSSLVEWVKLFLPLLFR